MKIITHIPWWVFILFAFLIKSGLNARRSTNVSIYKLFLMPVLFLMWSMLTLIKSPLMYIPWGMIGLISLFLTMKLTTTEGVVVDQACSKLQLPGNGYWILTILLTIFTIKFTLGYMSATMPNANFQIEIVNFMFSGIFTGAFWGRNLVYANVYFAGKVNFQPKKPNEKSGSIPAAQLL